MAKKKAVAKKKTAVKKATPSATEAAETTGGPGRGKKECPSCKQVTGPRTRKCKKCGHDFPIPIKSANKASNTGAQSATDTITKNEIAKALDARLGGPDGVEEVYAAIQTLGGIDAAKKLVGYFHVKTESETSQ